MAAFLADSDDMRYRLTHGAIDIDELDVPRTLRARGTRQRDGAVRGGRAAIAAAERACKHLVAREARRERDAQRPCRRVASSLAAAPSRRTRSVYCFGVSRDDAPKRRDADETPTSRHDVASASSETSAPSRRRKSRRRCNTSRSMLVVIVDCEARRDGRDIAAVRGFQLRPSTPPRKNRQAPSRALP